MRALTLLLCLLLAACAGGRTMPGDAGPAAALSGPAPAAPAGTSAAAAAASPAPPPAGPRDQTEAKVICWGKVEREKGLRSIDQRIAFVERCVADQLRGN